MQVKILFPPNKHDYKKALISTNICTKVSQLLPLPQYIEVEFSELKSGIYGETHLIPRNTHRIVVNIFLAEKEIIFPIVHELIHLNQIHEGRLAISRSGLVVWEGKTYSLKPNSLTIKDYNNLPWEQDVINRQNNIIQQILNM